MRELILPPEKINALRLECKNYDVFPRCIIDVYKDRQPEPVFSLLENIVNECARQFTTWNKEEVELVLNGKPSSADANNSQSTTSNDTKQNDKRLRQLTVDHIARLVKKGYFNYESFDKIDNRKSMVLNIYPDISDRFDKDGLLILDETFLLSNGGVKYKDHILNYHQGLRREFTGRPNNEFIAAYADCRRKLPNCILRIAIDHQRIAFAKHYQLLQEYDTWYGPRFKMEDIDNVNKDGVTCMVRRKPSFFDDGNNKLERTEISWQVDRSTGIKTLEIEEVSHPDRCFGDFHINRYIHAERDTKNKALTHFDGAIKVYSKVEYDLRIKTKMPREIKSPHKIKLFRIDGAIDLALFLKLTGMFFKGNEMILEYFDPQLFEKHYGENMRRYEERRQQQL